MVRSVFDQIETEMVGVVSDNFGSTYILIPMKSRPNKRPLRDVSRPAVKLTATKVYAHTLSDLDKNTRIDRAGSKRSMSFNNMSAKSIRLTVRLCDLVWEPVQHDAVQEVETGLIYEIFDVQGTGHSDMDLLMSEIEGPYAISD